MSVYYIDEIAGYNRIHRDYSRRQEWRRSYETVMPPHRAPFSLPSGGRDGEGLSSPPLEGAGGRPFPLEHPAVAGEVRELQGLRPIDERVEMEAVLQNLDEVVDDGAALPSAGPRGVVGVLGHGAVELLAEQFGDAAHGKQFTRLRTAQAVELVEVPGEVDESGAAHGPAREAGAAVGEVDDAREVAHGGQQSLAACLALFVGCQWLERMLQSLVIDDDDRRLCVFHKAECLFMIYLFNDANVVVPFQLNKL